MTLLELQLKEKEIKDEERITYLKKIITSFTKFLDDRIYDYKNKDMRELIYGYLINITQNKIKSISEKVYKKLPYKVSSHAAQVRLNFYEPPNYNNYNDIPDECYLIVDYLIKNKKINYLDIKASINFVSNKSYKILEHFLTDDVNIVIDYPQYEIEKIDKKIENFTLRNNSQLNSQLEDFIILKLLKNNLKDHNTNDFNKKVLTKLIRQYENKIKIFFNSYYEQVENLKNSFNSFINKDTEFNKDISETTALEEINTLHEKKIKLNKLQEGY
jgi:hypothetical protein